MNVDFTKAFDKQFSRLSTKKQEQMRSIVALFLENPNAPSLRNHALKGEWSEYRSISVGGDLRLHFKIISANTIVFVAVGTHSQLYK